MSAPQQDVRDDTTRHDRYGEAKREVDSNGDAHHRHVKPNQGHSDCSTEDDHLNVEVASKSALDDGANQFSLRCKKGLGTGGVARERVHLASCL